MNDSLHDVSGQSKRQIQGAFLVSAMILLARIFYIYSPDVLIDDAFISFRYARNFAEGLGLVFNPGEKVEGYTNFLWTFILGLCSKLGFDLPTISVILASLFALGTLAIFGMLMLRWLDNHPREGLLASLPLILFAAMGSQARFAVSGMETLLFVFLLTLAIYLFLYSHPVFAGIVFGLTALTRPEGLMYFGIAIAFEILFSRETPITNENRFRQAFYLLISFLAIYFPYFLWRYFYYGFVFPNTFYAKASGFDIDRMLRGWQNLTWILSRWNIFLILGLAMIAAINMFKKRNLIFIIGIVVVTFIYFIVVGGDFVVWFGPRFLMPALTVLLLLSVEGLWLLLSKLRLTGWIAKGVFAGITIILLYNAIWFSWPEKLDRMTLFANQMRSWKEIGAWMSSSMPKGTTVAVDAVGLIPYYSNFYSIDMFGLTDQYIAHKVMPAQTVVTTAHEKFDPEYILERDPDCIVSTWIDNQGLPISAGLGEVQDQINEKYHLVAVAKNRNGEPINGNWVLVIDKYSAELYNQGYQSGVYCKSDERLPTVLK
jgi:hypothetical protein